MSLQEIKIFLKQKLASTIDAVELTSLMGMLIEAVTGWNRMQQIVNINTELTKEHQAQLENYAEQLLNGKPIQYILGKAWFMGNELMVNEHVLIPRPETEELVEWIISYASIINKSLSILDIGTGSGCIPIALKLALSNCIVTGLDISKEALAVAQNNAKNLNAPIHWVEKDILNTAALETSYDIIVSNPPYIPLREKKNMQEQILNFEPSIALFVSNEDPLIYYRVIAKIGKQNLSKNGQLFFEIHYDQGNSILALLDELNYHAELRKDSFGKNRMIRASLK
ncbi:MAG: peptide chain release factor N(5)-glutamine methyltransferase [Chitinophagia bacterium]|jgi:release factor glutamine methyltransferase|nr:peptide chain release factor N(5)-glutamine methyltransferase [Chitinophagia bacterium]NCA29432.1 peptide chain release factor N(5)-glutamine methyltransferase [Chitinophagia bacterium]NDD17017.1 peptide chain release factor N(5)-glutamine methyltransferase [Chitinophagia bacterium]